jgi:FkbM family methyltransferase
MENNILREKIINKISKKALIFESRDRKFWRFIHDPFGVSIYLLLKIISKIHPIWITKKMPWGGRMSFYIPEGNQIYYYGFCESNLTIFLIRFIVCGSTFIDVGANIGFYTMLASFLVGDTGKVLSIEATPRTFSTLYKNSLLKKNIFPKNIALSDKEKEVILMDYGEKFSGTNSINSNIPKEVMDFIKTKGTPIKIKATTLDKLLSESEHRGFSPNFIKMDVEGYESNILQGMISTINTYRPIISVEMCKHPEWQDNVSEAFRILTDSKYDSFEISEDGYLKPCSIDDYTDINIVFIPREKISENAWLVRTIS